MRNGIWRAPNLFVVVRCVGRPRDVWIRWPEAWRPCDRCGEMALGPSARADSARLFAIALDMTSNRVDRPSYSAHLPILGRCTPPWPL
jgi:hypothetical protein